MSDGLLGAVRRLVGVRETEDVPLEGWPRLRALIHGGDVAGVAAAVTAATADERRQWAGELRTAIPEQDFSDWHLWVRRMAAVRVAGAACLATPAQVAAWLTRREQRWLPDEAGGETIAVLAARDVPWRADLADRLAKRMRADNRQRDWPLVAGLVRSVAGPVPTGEQFVRGWVDDWSRHPGTTLADRLRQDPFLDTLLPYLFDIDGIGTDLAAFTWSVNGAAPTTTFGSILAGLAAEGRLDRAALLDGCLGRFLRGDRPTALRAFVHLHEALRPTPDEVADRTLDYLRLLPEAPPSVAAVAQQALRDLDTAGRLARDTLVEAGRAVLARPEKKLVRTQLSWLDAAVRRDGADVTGMLDAAVRRDGADVTGMLDAAVRRDGADVTGMLDAAARRDRAAAAGMLDAAVRRDRADVTELLDVVADALGHPAPDLRDRALAVLARRARHADPARLAQLRYRATGLTGDQAERAAAVFGVPVEPAPAPVTAPPVPPPGPAPMPPPIATVAEFIEEMATYRLGPRWTVVTMERLMAALVRFAHADRAGLAAALESAGISKAAGWRHDAVWVTSAALAGIPDAGQRPHDVDAALIRQRRAALSWSPTTPLTPHDVVRARLAELVVKLRRHPIPTLLATPTHVTGHIDAATLVDRVAAAEAAGWEPWPVDLAQALARLPRPATAGALASAGALAAADAEVVAAAGADGEVVAAAGAEVVAGAGVVAGGEVVADAGVVAAARRLTSPAGRMLAARLTGPAAGPVARRVTVDAAAFRQRWQRPQDPDRRVIVTVEPTAATLPGDLRRNLSILPAPQGDRSPGWLPYLGVMLPLWPAVLPSDRDVIAAHALPYLATTADIDESWGQSAILPLLAECSGPAGPGLSLALAYTCAAKAAADRVAATDALLTLASAGDLDAAALGADLGTLVAGRLVKLSRAVVTLTDLAQAGAPATVWGVAAAALPAILATDRIPPGTPDLLSLAVTCADAVPARTPVPGVAEVAARPGTSRLVTEARRLHHATTR